MLRMKIVRVDGGLFYSRIYVQIPGYASVLNGLTGTLIGLLMDSRVWGEPLC